MVISKKTIIFKGFRGGSTFSRGLVIFQGGGGEGGDPISPLWIRTCDFITYFSYFKRKH